jgi:hypothetical protein
LKAKQSILSIFLLLSFGLVIETKCQSWNSEPKAGFTVKSISGISCEDKVSFSDTSKIVNACNIAGDSCDQVSEWFWDFGDGTTSNLRNPSHDYTHADFTKGHRKKTEEPAYNTVFTSWLFLGLAKCILPTTFVLTESFSASMPPRRSTPNRSTHLI